MEGFSDEVIVQDSSVWRNNDLEYLADAEDNVTRVGTIKTRAFIEELDDYRYIVEVWDGNNKIPIECTLNTRFGGLYNYEEFTSRGFSVSGESENINSHSAKPGDHVLVVYAYGDPKEGLIISQLKHPARRCKISEADGIAYESEFNGWNQRIYSDGSMKVTQKLTPININILDEPPEGQALPEPVYSNQDGLYATSYEFAVDGSYSLSDNSKSKPQSFYMDKTNGTMNIFSGNNTLVMDKNAESITLTNKLTDITASKELKITTGGTIFKTLPGVLEIETTDIKSKGKWDQTGNMKVTGNHKVSANSTVDGNFTSEGITKLGGGDNALIYDIVLTIGTGNLGAPVISNHTLLKTVKTKAT